MQLPSGTTGDGYDNALDESIIGLFKTEVINPRGLWKSVDAVEYAALEWVDWFNNRRLIEPIGDIPRAEFIGNGKLMAWWRDLHKHVSGIPGTVHIGRAALVEFQTFR